MSKKLNLGGKTVEVTDEKCLTCGTEWGPAADEIEACPECCPHENTEEVPLLGVKCEDCGTQVDA